MTATHTLKDLRHKLKELGLTVQSISREGRPERGEEMRYASMSYRLSADGEYLTKRERDALITALFRSLRDLGFDKPHDWSFEKDFLRIQAYCYTIIPLKGTP